MKYTLVTVHTSVYSGNDAFKRLEDQVASLIEEGWEPQGGVTTSCAEGYIFVAQAMILGQRRLSVKSVNYLVGADEAKT